MRSETFVAHIRYASTGGLTASNTHPFEQRGPAARSQRRDRGPAEARSAARELPQPGSGDTDSERFFALVTKETDQHGGDVTAGLIAAARWVAEELPLFALNVVLITSDELWALRYPETHALYVLERRAGGALEQRQRRRHSARAQQPTSAPARRRRRQRADGRGLRAGAHSRPASLLHVDDGLRVSSTIAIDHPPRHPLTLADLAPRAAASQSIHQTRPPIR